jgi:hypothetical protein
MKSNEIDSTLQDISVPSNNNNNNKLFNFPNLRWRIVHFESFFLDSRVISPCSLKNKRRLLMAAYRSLSPQNVMTRKSWDRLLLVNKTDIYIPGHRAKVRNFSIMTIRQCDSVAKAFSLMPVSFYIEPYLLIFLKTICASSWQRKSAKI